MPELPRCSARLQSKRGGGCGRPANALQVCLGSVEEKQSAIGLIMDRKRRVIFEPIALYELHRLNALPQVEATIGRPAVVRTTLQEIRTIATELDLNCKGYMTTFEKDGAYYRANVTAKQVAQELRDIQELYDWTREHCEIVPAIPATDPSPETTAALQRVLAPSAHDTLLAAQGGGFVLVSDDWNLRRLARNDLGVDGIWIQALLMHASDTKRLKQDHYNRSVATLAAWRHMYTSINADQLFFVATRGHWKITSEFQALASMLSLSRCEFTSNLRVVVEFLQRLWTKHGPTRTQATRLTAAVLRASEPNKSPSKLFYFQALEALARRGVVPRQAWEVIKAEFPY